MNTIKGMIEDLNNKDTHIGGCTTVGELIIALEGLQMLEEQQPCKDCISREEAINELKLAYFNKDLQSAKDDPCIVDAMTDWSIRTIKNLPSVTSQPKRGKWIDQADSIGEYASGCYECDKCHEVFWLESGTPQDNEYNFCPNCGADMREVKENG